MYIRKTYVSSCHITVILRHVFSVLLTYRKNTVDPRYTRNLLSMNEAIDHEFNIHPLDLPRADIRPGTASAKSVS